MNFFIQRLIFRYAKKDFYEIKLTSIILKKLEIFDLILGWNN